MFESALEEKFKKIFDLEKVSFNAPGESEEQECLFIDIEKSRNTIKDGRAIARVNGKASVFANADKLPFGYFQKRIQQSDPALTKDLFFFDLETNSRQFANIAERTFSFVYFYDSQYDPATGSLTSTTIEVSDS